MWCVLCIHDLVSSYVQISALQLFALMERSTLTNLLPSLQLKTEYCKRIHTNNIKKTMSSFVEALLR